MAVYVKVYWFNDNEKNIVIDEVKVSDTYSRRRMEATARNYRFDDLWINREAGRKVKEYIRNSNYHNELTAVAIDEVLLDPILIKPEKERKNE